MVAIRYSEDHWNSYCPECGTGGGRLLLNPEGPLLANPTIVLRDMHNRVFHDRNKIVDCVAAPLYYVRCRECFEDGRRILDKASREESDLFIQVHNETFHSET